MELSKNNLGIKNIIDFLSRTWLLIFTILLGLVVGLVEPSFFHLSNLMSVLSTACLTGIASCGLVYVQATGELDFSTGAVMSWSATVLVVLLHKGVVDNFPTAAAIAVLSCLLVGLMNAFFHISLGIPAFLATLASANIMKGLALLLSNNTTIYKGNWDSQVFTFLGQHRIGGIIPMSFIVFAIVAVVNIFVLEKTKLGKTLYAVGGNNKACNYVGINVTKNKIIAFLICALLCGLSGIVQASVTNGGGPQSGDSFQMQTILVCILGSTFIKKGITNIPGALIGSILVTMVANAITLIGANTFWQNASQGLVLLLGVLVNVLIRKHNERA